eukprot:603761-Prorocentrum_minimum.AAC.1
MRSTCGALPGGYPTRRMLPPLTRLACTYRKPRTDHGVRAVEKEDACESRRLPGHETHLQTGGGGGGRVRGGRSHAARHNLAFECRLVEAGVGPGFTPGGGGCSRPPAPPPDPPRAPPRRR